MLHGRSRIDYTVVRLITLQCISDIINPLCHCRHCARGNQYKCDRSVSRWFQWLVWSGKLPGLMTDGVFELVVILYVIQAQTALWFLWVNCRTSCATRKSILVQHWADIFCGRPPDLWLFELKIGTPVTPAQDKVYTNFSFRATFFSPPGDYVQ